MKRKKNLLSLMIFISLALHGALFFLAPGYSVTGSRVPKPDHSPDPFALVNLALIEPAAPKAPVPRPPESPPALSEASPDDRADIGPADISPADIDPAETFIPVAEHIPVNLDLPPAAGSTTDTATFPASLPSEDGDAGDALTTAYVKRNYEYIQRRIRDKLVFPPQARRAGIQGNAEISFTIHEDGRVSDVTVSRSSGSELLDTAAVDAIYAASPFRPPPAEARLAIPINFRLR